MSFGRSNFGERQGMLLRLGMLLRFGMLLRLGMLLQLGVLLRLSMLLRLRSSPRLSGCTSHLRLCCLILIRTSCSCLILGGLVLSCLIRSCLVLIRTGCSCLILGGLVLSCLIRSCPILGGGSLVRCSCLLGCYHTVAGKRSDER